MDRFSSPFAPAKKELCKWTKLGLAPTSCSSTPQRHRPVVSPIGWWMPAAQRHRRHRLAPGSRLPATRVLATDLAVSRGVVVEAYRRLTDEGLVGGRGGGGTTVLVQPARVPAATPRTRAAARRTAAAAASPAADKRGRRPVAGRSRSVRISPQPVAADRTHRPDRDTAGGTRLRRSAWTPAVARCAGAVARPDTRVAGRAGRHHRRLRRCTGHGTSGATTAPRWHRIHRGRGSRITWSRRRIRVLGTATRPRSGGRRRDPGGCVDGHRRPRRIPHARTPVSDGRGAGAAASARAARVGDGRGIGHRGRLRRGVPLRPCACSGAARRGTRPHRLCRKHLEEPGSRAAAGVARRAAASL